MINKTPKWIIGIDEVGRGPVAGPVTVCAFISERNFDTKTLFPNQTIRDSKKTKILIRQSINQSIRYLRKSKQCKIDWVIASVSAEYIDTHGIVESIDACITKCIEDLKKRNYPVDNAKIYLDGGLRLKNGVFNQETIIKGDEKIGHIAVASILAKVSRDSYMLRMAKQYPLFNWESNVGYGTKFHYEAINKYGLTPLHRVSFLS